MSRHSFISNFKKLPGAFLAAAGIVILLHSIELFVLPVTFFTFRVWEALAVYVLRPAFPGPFYPMRRVELIEEGDLGHHGPLAVKRRVEWETDRQGYRRREDGAVRFGIVLVGDSSVVGPGLTQSETLAAALERKIGTTVYPFAVADIDAFFGEERFQREPPGLVLLVAVERHIPALPAPSALAPPSASAPARLGVQYLKARPDLAVILDRICKNSGGKYLAAEVNRLKKRFIACLRRDRAPLPEPGPAGAGGRMLFYEGKACLSDVPDEKLEEITRAVCACRDVVRVRGSRFIFLPVPNKENIYYDYIPLERRPVFLGRLISRLRAAGVRVIDTQSAFDRARRDHPGLLYQRDDSHWNARGVEVATDLVAAEWVAAGLPPRREGGRNSVRAQ